MISIFGPNLDITKHNSSRNQSINLKKINENKVLDDQGFNFMKKKSKQCFGSSCASNPKFKWLYNDLNSSSSPHFFFCIFFWVFLIFSFFSLFSPFFFFFIIFSLFDGDCCVFLSFFFPIDLFHLIFYTFVSLFGHTCSPPNHTTKQLHYFFISLY